MTAFDFCRHVAEKLPAFKVAWLARLTGPYLLDDNSLRAWLETFPEPVNAQGETLSQILAHLTPQEEPADK